MKKRRYRKYFMKKRRNRKYQCGVRLKSKKKGINSGHINTIDKEEVINIKVDFIKRVKTIAWDILTFLAVLFLVYIIELFFISHITPPNEMSDIILLLFLFLFPISPFIIWHGIIDQDSDKIKKEKFELYDLVVGTLFVVSLGYVTSVIRISEETKIRLTLYPLKRILELAVIILTPVKLYYSVQKFRYSRKATIEK